jgi:hypothetical protein
VRVVIHILDTLQELHDLEIAGGIEWLYDGAWHVWIGNPKLADANVSSEEEAKRWLREKAAELYPRKPSPSQS